MDDDDIDSQNAVDLTREWTFNWKTLKPPKKGERILNEVTGYNWLGQESWTVLFKCEVGMEAIVTGWK